MIRTGNSSGSVNVASMSALHSAPFFDAGFDLLRRVDVDRDRAGGMCAAGFAAAAGESRIAAVGRVDRFQRHAGEPAGFVIVTSKPGRDLAAVVVELRRGERLQPAARRELIQQDRGPCGKKFASTPSVIVTQSPRVNGSLKQRLSPQRADSPTIARSISSARAW